MADVSLLIYLCEVGIRDTAQSESLTYTGFQGGVGVGIVELFIRDHTDNRIGVVDDCIEESPELAATDILFGPITQCAVQSVLVVLRK